MEMVLRVLMKMKARGDEDGGHRAPGAPAWRRGGAGVEAPRCGAPEEGGSPWGFRPLAPSSSLVMVLV